MSDLAQKPCDYCATPIIRKTRWSHKEWSRKRYCSFKCHGHATKPSTNTEDTFWSLVNKTPTCWLWQGRLKHGYGQYRLWGRTWGVHQIAYKILTGDIPVGMTVDHLCRVRNCVNPEHLEVVTGQENTHRATIARTHCKHGHEFTPENTYVMALGRSCVACRKRLGIEYRQRQKEAAGLS